MFTQGHVQTQRWDAHAALTFFDRFATWPSLALRLLVDSKSSTTAGMTILGTDKTPLYARRASGKVGRSGVVQSRVLTDDAET